MSNDEINDLRLCEPTTVSFDVKDRYLMGFMGSLKDNDVVELGPILSKKIVSQDISNFVITSDDYALPSGDITTIFKEVCNDDYNDN
jgi:hypothetical protein